MAGMDHSSMAGMDHSTMNHGGAANAEQTPANQVKAQPAKRLVSNSGERWQVPHLQRLARHDGLPWLPRPTARSKFA